MKEELPSMTKSPSTLKDKIAFVISRIFDIPIILPPMLILAVWKANLDKQESLLWLLVGVVFLLIIPGIYFLYQLQSGGLSDWDLTQRQERNSVYLVSGVSWATMFVITKIYDGPLILKSFIVTGLAVGLISFLINFRWKISLHTASTTMSAIFLGIVVSPWWYLALLIVPLVAWARLEMDKHTLPQLYFGALLAGILTYLIFRYYGF